MGSSDSVEPDHPKLRPNRRSAASLQELLQQVEDSASEPSLEPSLPGAPSVSGSRTSLTGSRTSLTAESVQALLDQVEDNGLPPTTISVMEEPPMTRNSRSSSVSSLQRLLADAEGDVSPSVVPPSGVYSTTPVSFIRSSVGNASLQALLNETDENGNPRMPRPPLVRRVSSKQDLVSTLDDALDTVETTQPSTILSSPEDLAASLNDVLAIL